MSALSSFWDVDSHLISHCPLCDVPGSALDIHVLGDNDDATLLHVTCESCKQSLLAIVFSDGEGADGSVGFMTDLSHEDVLRFQDEAPVSTDDVLASHIALKSGGLEEVLQKEIGS
jgi:hypothetical protein